MSQPINVVRQSAIADIRIEASRPSDAQWGYKNSADVFRGIMALSVREDGYVDLSKIVNYLRSQWTSKMIGGANKELMKLEAEIKKLAVKI